MTGSGAEAEYDADVLVVGAGPVGLTVACALLHHGVRTRVVERRNSPRDDSRANNLWSRPQELLASIGVRDVLATDAYPVRRAEILLDGRPLDTIDFAQVPSPYPAVLYSSQAVIERQLRQVLADGGVEVEGGLTLVSLEQDADGVDVQLEVQDGGQPTNGSADAGIPRLRSRYVVGADGAHSAVRDAVGIAMSTTSFEGRATRQIDAKLAWRRPTEPDSLWFFTYRHGFAGVLPITGGYHRLFFVEDDAEIPDRDPTLEEMEARARETTGDPTVSLSDPVWLSHSRFSYGVAARYADRRVFLAGDAGHVNLPIGGQGMNAGLHDAIGLAWRLAMTLAGAADEPVLRSYAEERHREHLRLDEQQVTGFRRLMYRNAAQDVALGVAAGALPNLGTRLFGAGELQQLAVSYPDSELTEDHPPLRSRSRRHIPKAGDRAPNARVVLADGTVTTLFDQQYNPDGHSWGWCLLAFDGRNRRSRATVDEGLGAAEQYSWIHPRLVLADPLPDEPSNRTARLFDLDGNAHAAYGLEATPTFVLIRPDGHIAYRSPAGRTGHFASYCRRLGVSAKTLPDSAAGQDGRKL